MTHLNELLTQISSQPMHSLFIILNICLLEIILSIDNAAVLAIMVKDLPEQSRNKALKYGIIGAYFFRGLALLFASLLVNIWWLKPIGGLYLIWMTYNFFKEKNSGGGGEDGDGQPDKTTNPFYKFALKSVGLFWATVIMVEFMDIVFSVDNIFAVVAFSDNIILICFGVFIGILAMRFVAQRFVKIMQKYPFLEKCAFVVIGILGIKLLLSLLIHFVPSFKWIESEKFDLCVSAVTILVFIIPIIYYNLTKKND